MLIYLFIGCVGSLLLFKLILVAVNYFLVVGFSLQ